MASGSVPTQGDPSCFSGPYTYETCCVQGDLACWDAEFTPQRCCFGNPVASVATTVAPALPLQSPDISEVCASRDFSEDHLAHWPLFLIAAPAICIAVWRCIRNISEKNGSSS